LGLLLILLLPYSALKQSLEYLVEIRSETRSLIGLLLLLLLWRLWLLILLRLWNLAHRRLLRHSSIPRRPWRIVALPG